MDGLQHMHIPAGQTYRSPEEAYVEGDASSASYFLAGDSPYGGTTQLLWQAMFSISIVLPHPPSELPCTEAFQCDGFLSPTCRMAGPC